MRKSLRYLAGLLAVLTPAAATAQTKGATTVPTLGGPGMIVLGAVLGVAGVVIQRRRRR